MIEINVKKNYMVGKEMIKFVIEIEIEKNNRNMIEIEKKKKKSNVRNNIIRMRFSTLR